jgi:hypothetical protein
MKELFKYSLFYFFGIITVIAINVYKSEKSEQPTPEPFQLRTIQVQQGKALVTICIDKRTETAVPCTAFYTLP